MDNVKKPVLAGTWYPGDPIRLRSDMERYLADTGEEKIDGKVMGLISPHAGYVYSGRIAACAYRAVRGNEFDAVIVIGPSHRAYFKGASIYNVTGYETPLGIMPVDMSLAGEMVSRSNNMISIVPDDRSPENSLELQIPFLQVVLGNIPFVPILLGTQDINTCRGVADAIMKTVGDRRVLIVASSDFSHYHDYDTAVTMDSAALEYIEKMDVEGFLQGIANDRFEACGAGGIVVMMIVAVTMGSAGVRILEYVNSGDITGDKSGVVGYAAVVFYGRDRNRDK